MLPVILELTGKIEEAKLLKKKTFMGFLILRITSLIAGLISLSDSKHSSASPAHSERLHLLISVACTASDLPRKIGASDF
ncbi:hypothetical protein KSP40_PGU019316 [Platanthera guangdongensis]|uniref:Uncharacterized protein n=1 Tax=Platanthera guangdongensis TaxID=2320717 RepID=A0ABR2MDL8_9ASPA